MTVPANQRLIDVYCTLKHSGWQLEVMAVMRSLMRRFARLG